MCGLRATASAILYIILKYLYCHLNICAWDDEDDNLICLLIRIDIIQTVW